MHQQNEQQHIDSNAIVCNNPQSKYQGFAYNHPYTLIVTRSLTVRVHCCRTEISNQNKCIQLLPKIREIRRFKSLNWQTDSD